MPERAVDHSRREAARVGAEARPAAQPVFLRGHARVRGDASAKGPAR